jgi:homocysteine S-methyltransferase
MSNQLKLNPIEAGLKKYSPLILDGALATELETHGCDLNDPLWSARVLLENPEAIEKVHADYFRAGADCVITASYQATVDGFRKRGIEKPEALELIKKTVYLAKQARNDFWKEEKGNSNRPKPIVAGSVGPYGAYLADGSEYVGNYGVSDQHLADFHFSRIQALAEAGADVLAFETIPSLQEAKVLASLLKEFPDTSAWLSFSLKDGETISDGTGIEECARMFNDDEQIAAIGVNCAPIPAATQAISILSRNTDKPIIVYPNSGETYNAETKTWHGEEAGCTFEEQSEIWYEAGARIIGGCCRTDPGHIEALAKRWR